MRDNQPNYRKFQPSHGAVDFLGNSVVFPYKNPNFYFKVPNSLLKQDGPTSCKIKNKKKTKDRANRSITISIHIKSLILFRRTTDEQSIKTAKKFEEKQKRMVAWGDVAACLFMTAHVTENVKVVFAKQISNLALIPHRLTTVL